MRGVTGDQHQTGMLHDPFIDDLIPLIADPPIGGRGVGGYACQDLDRAPDVVQEPFGKFGMFSLVLRALMPVDEKDAPEDLLSVSDFQ